jgi:predicted metal-dependent enzyme (double-stranded beta helix superfamily)
VTTLEPSFGATAVPVAAASHDLSEAELTALVRDLAARPKQWAHLVDHDPEQRRYELLLRDDHVAVWLICWMDDHDTGFHDHDVSAGAVAVVAGSVREERLVLGGGTVDRLAGAGESFSFAASDIHRVRHAGTEPAVTIHAYSPPLWRMGAYEVAETGELRRHSVSYAEELRPLDAAA